MEAMPLASDAAGSPVASGVQRYATATACSAGANLICALLYHSVTAG